MYCIIYVCKGVDNLDVDTDAAIRHIEMQGDEPVLGQVGPLDTLKMLDTEQKPGEYYLTKPCCSIHSVKLVHKNHLQECKRSS